MIRSIKNFAHSIEGFIAAFLYGFPSRKMFVIGVTGTDGKTTTSSMLYHILSLSGKKVALISTVGAYIVGKQYDSGFHVTTPTCWQLEKYIKLAKKQGAECLILEVTSHSIDQSRIAGIHFNVAVLTNITHEHLDYHKTFDRYRDTKLKLFQLAAKSILNRDDPSFEYFEKKLFGKEIISYSLTNDRAHFTPEKFKFKTQLFGDFNVANSLAAAAAAKEAGVEDRDIKKALSTFKAPVGRQQIVYDKKFLVLIDFAHTPNAFLRLLPEVRQQTKGRLIHVFGSAGQRDASKRPFMGEAAGKYDDIIILTAEDPRSEPVQKINDEIAAGIANSKFEIRNSKEIQKGQIQSIKNSLFKIPDRKEAIDFAISIASTGDTILLTGKGHEKSMNYGHGEEPWDEEKVAFVSLQKYE